MRKKVVSALLAASLLAGSTQISALAAVSLSPSDFLPSGAYTVKAGDSPITLSGDIEGRLEVPSSIGSLTINGNGKTLTTSGTAIGVLGNTNLTVSDLDIVTSGAGISIPKGALTVKGDLNISTSSSALGIEAKSLIVSDGAYINALSSGGIKVEQLDTGRTGYIELDTKVYIKGERAYLNKFSFTPSGTYTGTFSSLISGYTYSTSVTTDAYGFGQVWLPTGRYFMTFKNSSGQVRVAYFEAYEDKDVSVRWSDLTLDTSTSYPAYVPNGSSSYPSVSVATVGGTAPVASIVKPSNITAFRTAASSLAQELFKIKLFVGTSTTSQVFELDRSPTRLESLVIIIRLLGKEDAATKFTGANPFTDVPAWGDRYAAYAYSEGITVGVNNAHTLFDSASTVTYQQFTAFLLRSLNYQEKNGDFQYANALNKAVELGMYTSNERQSVSGASQFLRGDGVVSMVSALLTKVKGSNDTLLERLTTTNVITRAASNEFLAAVARIYNGVK